MRREIAKGVYSPEKKKDWFWFEVLFAVLVIVVATAVIIHHNFVLPYVTL